MTHKQPQEKYALDGMRPFLSHAPGSWKGSFMKTARFLFCWVLCGLLMLGSYRFSTAAESLKEQNEDLFRQLQQVHGLSDSQMNAIRAIFSKSGYIGQGNPTNTATTIII